MDTYEKKYNEAFEKAKKEYKGAVGSHCDVAEAVVTILQGIFPQLRESETIEIPFGAKDSELKGWEYTIPEGFEAEIKDGKVIVKEKESKDERIRKRIKGLIYHNDALLDKDELLAWLEKQKEPTPADGWDYADNRMSHPLYLEGFDAGRAVERELSEFEKQKENPKNAISIPADCASNAKCPYKIHGEGEFIGDIHDSPAYWRGWDDAMKHKESLHIPESCKENPDSFTDGQKEQKPIKWTDLTWKDIVQLEGIINNVNYEFRNGIGQESFGKEVLEKFREYKVDEYLDGTEQKPAEWSEEDKRMLNTIISEFEAMSNNCETVLEKNLCAEKVTWLKSLRPSWKPSEEHLSALLDVFNDPDNIGSQTTCQLALTDLYEQLKKL